MARPDDHDGFPRSFEDDEREGWVGFVPDFVKRVAVAGLGALFMTEEGIRGLAGQLKLPKEVLGFILSQAEKTKDEVGRVLSEELRRFLQSEKLREELVNLLSGMTVEIKAQVRLVPAAGAEAPAKEAHAKEDHAKEAHAKRVAGQEPAASAPRLVVSELTARRSRRGKKE